jgi:hypothetical protein
MKYQLTSNALEDLRNAALFYESKRLGLGIEFIIEAGIAVARVLDAPTSWPEK